MWKIKHWSNFVQPLNMFGLITVYMNNLHNSCVSYLCYLLSFAKLLLPGDGHLLNQLFRLFQTVFKLWSLQRLEKETQQMKLWGSRDF